MRNRTVCIAICLVGCGSAAPHGAESTSNGGSQSSAGAEPGIGGGGASQAGGTGGGVNTASGGTGGSSSGGTTDAASGGGGTASSGGSSGTLSHCEGPVAAGLPEGAPNLEVGTWTPINPEGFPFDENTSTLGVTVDPCNPSVIYLCTGSFDTSVGGLYKSTDAGSSWNRVGNIPVDWTGVDHLEAPLHVKVDPGNTEHVYLTQGVRGHMGFFVSSDGGENFELSESFAEVGYMDVYTIDVDPTDFDHVILSFHSPFSWDDPKYFTSAGVLETTDGGDSWIVHDPTDGFGFGHSVNFLYRPELGLGDSNTWLLGTQGAGMWRTTDAGTTWTQTSTNGIQHGGGTIYYDKEGILYAAGSPTNLRSTDNGESWTSIGASNGYNAIFGDGTHLYTAPCFGPTSMLTSLEGDGTTWTDFNSQKFDMGPFDMTIDPANHILYASNWGDGLFALKFE